jgi:membrane dipeptidase
MPGDFDFGLTVEQELHARNLHQSSITIDLVSMGPGGAGVYDRIPQDEIDARVPAEMPVWSRFQKVMTLPYELAAERTSDALREFCAGHSAASFPMGGVDEPQLKSARQVNEWADKIPWMTMARKAEDFRKSHAEGQYATYGFAQPTVVGLPGDFRLYDEAFDLGCRAIMLTYNNQDFVGAGCTERTNAGLTNFGRRLVRKLNDIGMLIDTSHCGRQTTLDACLFSDAPVMANHTGAAALFNHDRAKSDEEIEAIAATGGLIGVYALPFFLAPPRENPTFEVILDNIDHIVGLVGWQHVAIGTDWPFMSSHDLAEATIGTQVAELGFRPEHGVSVSRTTEGYEDARDFVNFTRGMVSRGYSDEQIQGILGGNFLKLFERVCG